MKLRRTYCERNGHQIIQADGYPLLFCQRCLTVIPIAVEPDGTLDEEPPRLGFRTENHHLILGTEAEIEDEE